ncbi:response regulator [Vibrio sp.]|nr:response regulator [Vibrio sp.]
MRILLVEDDQLLGQSMVTSLTREGFTVDWLQKGGGVASMLATEEFTAVILDLTLPDTDGLIILKEIRQKGYDLPIMILTARYELQDRVKGLDDGADEYIGKPFALEELLARLRVIIRRHSGSANHILEVGSIKMDLNSQAVTVQGEAIQLTPNELKILSTFLTNPNRVMSKAHLQQSLHGWDDTASENAIEVHVYNLRKKVGNKLIRNIRGVGYVIEK